MDYMLEALKVAGEAASADEVPVGAVIVRKGRIIARAGNLRESQACALAHAELLAIRSACHILGSWRLTDCHLYVTLEPCLMCAGAIIQARIPRVVFAAKDPKGGAMGSLYALHNDRRLNHNPEVICGPGEAESAGLLKDFFKKKRSSCKQKKHL